MDIIDEYIRQQSWRNWNQYIAAIPIKESDHVVDLGCSVGDVANIFSTQVSFVTGIDLNNDFINYCKSNQQPNQNFICSDFTKIDYQGLTPVTGIWSSFSISYLANPEDFLTSMYQLLQSGGWIALVDITCFISGNMLPNSKHYQLVKDFELESHKSGLYDFDFGSKMEASLAQAGFNVIHVDNNLKDAELNFDGAAEPDILLNWKARLARMQGMKNKHPNQYNEICKEVIESLESHEHTKCNNLRFVVATKT